MVRYETLNIIWETLKYLPEYIIRPKSKYFPAKINLLYSTSVDIKEFKKTRCLENETDYK